MIIKNVTAQIRTYLDTLKLEIGLRVGMVTIVVVEMHPQQKLLNIKWGTFLLNFVVIRKIKLGILNCIAKSRKKQGLFK